MAQVARAYRPPGQTRAARRPWRGVLAAVVLSLVGLACQAKDSSSVCVIRAQDYDQRCVVDSDCVAVTEVTGCGECACLTGAVNQSALASYHANLDRPLSLATVGQCNCPCESLTPRCCAGACTNSCGCPVTVVTPLDASMDADRGSDAASGASGDD